MAVVLGTSAGFVTTAPSADPGGGDTTIDGSSVVVKDTSPAGAYKITQIGWYRGSGTNTANFEIALYSDSAGVADARLFVDATNSSAAGGWITVAVDWAISPSTAYWLGLQMDAHTGSSTVDNATSGGSGTDVRTSQTTLNDPYGGGAVADADGMYAIYALVQTAPTVALNSPADASSDTDTTPTFDFTGTDAQADPISYQIQIDTVNTFNSQSPDIEIGNVVAGSASTGAGPFTLTLDNNKEDVYAFVAVRDDANNVLAVTYDGYPMTSIGNHTVTGGSVLEAQIFHLANAPIGSNTLSVSTSGSIGDVLGFGAMATKNIKQTSPVEDTDTGGESPGVEDPRSTSSTTITTGALIVDAISDRSAGLTVGGSQTQIFKLGTGDNMAASYRQATSTGAYAMEWDPTENTEDWAQIVLALSKGTRPLLNKFSHLDSGFVNPDDGGDTDPFTSGENIQYTVQGGDALAADTYYWRVRGIDPAGTNHWGAWSSTRSFTVTAGGGTVVKDMISGFIPFAR